MKYKSEAGKDLANYYLGKKDNENYERYQKRADMEDQMNRFTNCQDFMVKQINMRRICKML